MRSKEAKEFISEGQSNHQSKKIRGQRTKMLRIQVHTELEDCLLVAASRTGPRPTWIRARKPPTCKDHGQTISGTDELQLSYNTNNSRSKNLYNVRGA